MSNDMNEFLSHLADDIKKEIGNYSDWDIAEYPIVIQKDMISSGLIILKKQGEEISRISQKESFSKDIRRFFDPTKINKGTLTIYPNGEYESSFIWDEQAHLSNLVGGIQSFISFIIEELTYKILQQFPNVGILWNESVLTVPFVKGKIQPLQTKIKTQEGSIEHSILVNNVTSDESPWLSEQFEDMYHMTNEGDLKGVLSGNWNVLTIRFDNITGFNFDRDVSFEWREENA